MDFDRMIKKGLQELKSETDERRGSRIYIDIPLVKFEQLMYVNCSKIMIKRGNKHKLEFTYEQKKLIEILRDYLSGSGEFNPGKGVLILGTNGTGKTMIILAFIDLLRSFSRKVFNHYHAKQLMYVLKCFNEGKHHFNTSLYIEDVGKEEKEVKVYGDVSRPFPDLIDTIYGNSSGWHFACSNYSLTQNLEKFYGKTITSRIRELFNVYVLKGEDQRR
jgi:DNA replication protein DnaC